jgi:hypothetical protein
MTPAPMMRTFAIKGDLKMEIECKEHGENFDSSIL